MKKVIIIVLIVLAVAAIAYFTWKKMNPKEETTQVEPTREAPVFTGIDGAQQTELVEAVAAREAGNMSGMTVGIIG